MPLGSVMCKTDGRWKCNNRAWHDGRIIIIAIISSASISEANKFAACIPLECLLSSLSDRVLTTCGSYIPYLRYGTSIHNLAEAMC